MDVQGADGSVSYAGTDDDDAAGASRCVALVGQGI